MAETKHTPGPWKVVKNEVTRMVFVAGYPLYIAAANGLSSPEERQREADAALIAAAPELLEALKLAGIIIQGEWLNLGYKINRARNESTRNPLQVARDSLNRIRVKVIAAIAKAEPK